MNGFPSGNLLWILSVCELVIIIKHQRSQSSILWPDLRVESILFTESPRSQS